MILNKGVNFEFIYNNCRFKKDFYKNLGELIDYDKSNVIYGIHNLEFTDKWYIGQSKDLYQRLWNTRNRDGHCQKIDRKDGFIYENGVSKFELVILSVNPENLDKEESYYCNLYKSYECGYNKSIDGKGRWQKGLVYWINPITRDEVRLPRGVNPPEGFIKGSSTLGTKCYYNPESDEMIKLLPGDNVPEGFIKGNKIKGMKVYRNIYTGKVIRLTPGSHVPEGFVIGNNTTGKLRVFSIKNKRNYLMTKDQIINSDIDDLRLGCHRGDWNDNKWLSKDIIDKNNI